MEGMRKGARREGGAGGGQRGHQAGARRDCGITGTAVRVREAETALRAEQRRAEERDKRWWAAELREDKENRPPPYLQVERVYKGQIKDLRARLALSEAQRKAAEAESELRWLLLGREEWEHSRTRCKLSGNV